MKRIALCDDEESLLEELNDKIINYFKNKDDDSYSIDCFKKSRSLLDSQESYDLYILDIYIDENNGVEIAKMLQKENNSKKIVFLTSTKEFAFDAYQLDVLQYLLKPIENEKLKRCLDTVFGEQDREYVLFDTKNKIEKVLVDQIKYCELTSRKLMIHTVMRDIIINRTMKQVREQLKSFPQFAVNGASFIVNLDFVEKIDVKDIYISGGAIVPIPRGKFESLKKKFITYNCEKAARI